MRPTTPIIALTLAAGVLAGCNDTHEYVGTYEITRDFGYTKDAQIVAIAPDYIRRAKEDGIEKVDVTTRVVESGGKEYLEVSSTFENDEGVEQTNSTRYEVMEDGRLVYQPNPGMDVGKQVAVRKGSLDEFETIVRAVE